MNVDMQQAAQLSVQANLIQHDIRRGYRGPLRIVGVKEQAAFLSSQEAQYSNPPAKNSIVEGVLVGFKDHNAPGAYRPLYRQRPP